METEEIRVLFHWSQCVLCPPYLCMCVSDTHAFACVFVVLGCARVCTCAFNLAIHCHNANERIDHILLFPFFYRSWSFALGKFCRTMCFTSGIHWMLFRLLHSSEIGQFVRTKVIFWIKTNISNNLDEVFSISILSLMKLISKWVF